MRILTVSTIYPGRDFQGQGEFIRQRMAAVPAPCEVTVARLRPWFPLIGLLKPHLASSSALERVDDLDVHDVRFFYTPAVGKDRDGARLGRAVEKFARSNGPFDLIDAHFAYPAGAGAVMAGRSLGLPVCITLRGTMPGYLNDSRRTPIIEALRQADRVIAVSESLAVVARDAVGDDLDVRVIPNGIDPSFSPGEAGPARERLGLPIDRPLMLTVAGLVPRKGVARVLEVLANVREQFPDLLYVVVGGGWIEGDHERELRAMAAALGGDDSVRFAGAVAHDRLPDYYRAADLFCLATANEGWANVLQESLACGTPVVATDVGGNREVLGATQNGAIVPFGEAEALEKAIIDALGRDWSRGDIASWGGRRSWKTVGREVAEVFDECIRRD